MTEGAVLPRRSLCLSADEVTGSSSQKKTEATASLGAFMGSGFPAEQERAVLSPPFSIIVADGGRNVRVQDSAAEVVRNYGRRGGFSSFINAFLKPVWLGFSGAGESCYP